MSWVENNEWLKPPTDTRIGWQYLRRFLTNYRPFWRHLTAVGLLALVASLTAFLIPPIFGTVQTAVIQSDSRLLLLAMLAYLSVMLFIVVVNYFIRISRAYVTTRLNQEILLQYYVKLLNISIEDFIAFKQRSNLFQRVIDAIAVTGEFTEVVTQSVQSIIMITVLMIIIGMLSPVILAVVAVGALALFLFVYAHAPRLRLKRQRVLAVQYPMIAKMLEIIDGIFTIKALTASFQVTSDIRDLVNARRVAEYEEVVTDTRGIQGAQFISSCAQALALGISFVFLIQQKLQYSEAFALYILVSYLLIPVIELAKLYQQLSALSVNVKNYYEVLNIPDESEQVKVVEPVTNGAQLDATHATPGVLREAVTGTLNALEKIGDGKAASVLLQPGTDDSPNGQFAPRRDVAASPTSGAPGREGAGHIIFRDVEFAYRGGNPILQELNFEIQPGEKISLIGRSGSGKTTLLRLLMGFLYPQRGEILVDGVDVAYLSDKNAFRRHFSVVSQQDFFFNTTIRENLLFGLNRTRPDSDIEEALRLVNLWDDVKKLDRRLSTVYTDATFSGGQKQRFFIARSLLRDPTIVLLDEPTSALDFENEGQVIKAIETLVGGRTTITIAHRLSTVRSSDRVLVLNDRRIVASGTHAELLASNDYYRALCQYNSFIL